MRVIDRLYHFFILLFFPLLIFGQELPGSIFSGNTFKIYIPETGIYKIDHDYLISSGINPDEVNPANLKIIALPGGSLPQLIDDENNLPREIPLKIKNNSSSFTSETEVYFYAESIEKTYYSNIINSVSNNKSVYADSAFVYISLSGNSNSEIIVQEELQDNSGEYAEWITAKVKEKDEAKILISGKDWYFKPLFNSNNSRTFELPTINTGSTSTDNLKLELISSVTDPSTVSISVDNLPLANLSLPQVSSSDYANKGISFIKDYELTINNSESFQVDFSFSGQGSFYIDRLISYSYNSGSYIPLNIPSFIAKSGSIQVPNNSVIWDINKWYQPKEIIPICADNSCSIEVKKGQRFIIFENNQVQTPPKAEKIRVAPIASYNSDYLIISDPSLKNEARYLAEYRNSKNNFQVDIVTPKSIYAIYGLGRKDVTALRNYIYHNYKNGGGKLKYLLLAGNASYDFRGIDRPGTDIVSAYQSNDSTDPVYSYVSDDYYGFLEKNEGIWQEQSGQWHDMDISVGRIPTDDPEALRGYIEKIKHYESISLTDTTAWQNKVVMIADDGDYNAHIEDINILGSILQQGESAFNVKKLALDDFPQKSLPSGQRSPEFNEAMIEAMNKGALMVSYTGHGKEEHLGHEEFFNDESIAALKNLDKLPIFVTATCEYGRFDFPPTTPGAEKMLFNPSGGAIVMLTTTRPVSIPDNFKVNNALIEVLRQKNIRNMTVGQWFREIKNLNQDNRGSRGFVLLGDPAVKPAIPKHEIKIKEIKNLSNNTDTLSALSRIRISGIIVDPLTNQIDEDFNGKVDVNIFDQPVSRTTIGDESNPYTYEVTDNYIFKGKTDAINGEFEFEFTVSKNIDYRTGHGKASFYSVSTKEIPASGFYTNLKISGSNPSPEIDNKAPEIEAYINSPNFINGQEVSSSSVMIARLSDENGINLSNRSLDFGPQAILDDTTFIGLSEYYTSFSDDETKGTISLPLEGLKPGYHKLTLIVRDNFNNPTSIQLDFNVKNENGLVIYKASNYPNPVNDHTTFAIDHNRPGESLNISMEIFSIQGESVLTYTTDVISRSNTLEIADLNLPFDTDKFRNGIYVYRIIVRSNRDGAKNEIYNRMILQRN
ncbi:type IX secretion system sortase PorU [Mangrovivirga sp. M17]|uniref:Type IX secretion system sortase PorU n=1 Tax=Mangrovivirga halotolerans TaxID=2993936 RepID=A0ABT3RM45_9BACT|nr:type IX secretion system sortase PorU [Mangrovivirga halotolerans]MCX2742895.1 type IX secretion system sortase PorU [Mangrovivirga halotolerans]